MSDDMNSDALARFDALLGALAGCSNVEDRIRLIGNFVSDETAHWEQAELDVLRARDQVSDEELVARIQARPVIRGAVVLEPMGSGRQTRTAGAENERGDDFRSALSLAVLVFLTVVLGLLAALQLCEGEPTGRVVALVIGALMSLALGAFVGTTWLRHVREREPADDRLLGRDSDMDAAFNRPNRSLLATEEAEPIQISAAHLQLSDDFMKDALAGVLSQRGACDAAFESGYLALLSVLTKDERVNASHPSNRLVALASRRLGLASSRGVALATIRYSYEEWPSFVEVVAWAEEVRMRTREVEGK